MNRKPIIAPPWGGWDNSAPPIALPNNSFREITNWLVNKGRLTPFPKSIAIDLPPGGQAFHGARTFQDVEGYFHTLCLNRDRGWYRQTNGAYFPLLPSSWNPYSDTPYAIEIMQNQAYFTNGGMLRYVIGDNNWYDAGDAPGGSYYLGKLASHLLMINTVENQSNFPTRVRWSGSGDPLEWDSSVDFTAGATDIADVEDMLTGWATIHNVGFAFRTNGITAFTPTGVSAAPFFIENYSIGPSGIGNAYPGGLAVYGQICAFPAVDDVYIFSGGPIQPIGGKAKKSIYADLNAATGQVVSNIFGTLNGGIDYLSYWLGIPMENTRTSLWIYHFDDQTWVNINLPYGEIRSIANLYLV